jgi:formate-dependent nitrite reductase cytochrome c552 subunit
MAQIFKRWTNYVPLFFAIAIPVGLVGTTFFVWYYWSPKYTDVGYQPIQPVPFSHKLHAGDLGIDCRYCHNTVERAAHAAIPPTATCMNCHSTILTKSFKLKEVRKSFETGDSIKWKRVHLFPDYAHFNHSAHIAAGVGCATCHGRVDQMDTVYQAKPLSMGWCLDCHRNPTPGLRPVNQVTNMQWDSKKENYNPHLDLDRRRVINPPTISCSGCHR